ncbi:c-type cytochrome [Novosphingobium sp. JCM 18896]|uniref:c-type cytochrome n=1 Tax=Novosphingobium sp. JCM 18896 TaxID=2989731 RepID=UPI0022233F2D|nr:cytochrome c [Novosphingobium sp. JCM 18896]MCW1427796.1 cytochrome c [Novosphingobium sp. JCM 18896]
MTIDRLKPAKLRALAVIVFAGIAAAPLLAAPADQIRTRIDGYRDLGAAFKTLNDGLRAPSPQPAVLRAATQRIRAAASHQYGWYPAGSGPRPGVKTAAKPEIWTQGPRFRQLQDGFAAQAGALERAVGGGNVAAIRTAARSLGGSCKACHDQFRVEKN